MTGIILDTCVISEPKRPKASVGVERWLSAQDPLNLFLTATVVAELAEGIERLPPGRRQADFRAWLNLLVQLDFAGRILAFDTEDAKICGQLAAAAYAQGRPPQVGDAQIAAVARRHGMTVATRNVRDFEVFGVPVVNPWDHA